MWTFNYEGKVMSFNYEINPLFDGGFQSRIEKFGVLFNTKKQAEKACKEVAIILKKIHNGKENN